MCDLGLCEYSYTSFLDKPVVKMSKEEIKRIKGTAKANKFLTEYGIDYKLCLSHHEVGGCDESEQIYKKFEKYLKIDYSICKHMLVRERKGEKRVYLIIVDKNKKVDLAKMKDMLECKKLEFVSPEDMKSLIDTTPGNVSVFNMVSDQNQKVNLILDKDILSYSLLAFHPLYNGMTAFVSPTEVMDFLKRIKRIPNIVEVPEKEMEKEVEKEKVKQYV